MRKPHPGGNKCAAKTKSGAPCKFPLGHGTSHLGVGRCHLHGGLSPNAEVAGLVTLARDEARGMAVALPTHPHEAIIRCIAIAAGEVEFCSQRIMELEDASVVAAPVTRIIREDGGGGARNTEVRAGPPALNAWVAARHLAMDRLVAYSAAALRAGVERRAIEIAEDTARQVTGVLLEFARLAGLDPDAPAVKRAGREALQLVAGGQGGA